MAVPAQEESPVTPIERALRRSEALFRAGRFDEADRVCRGVLRAEPCNVEALVRRGRVSLLANRLTEAEEVLEKVAESSEAAGPVKELLAELCYRQGRFQEAAQLFGALGREAVQKKLSSLSRHQAYLVEQDEEAVAPFVRIDPIPVVNVAVNGNPPVNFAVDTGGAELTIDWKYAKEAGLERISDEQVTEELRLGHAIVDLVEVGGMAVRHVPAHLLDIRRLCEPAFGELRIDGVIGTIFLYHFLATIDYPRGQLILCSKREETLQEFYSSLSGNPSAIEVPFRLTGDHFIIAEGSLDDSGPLLFFVDTGLENGSFLTSMDTAERLGISLDETGCIEERTIYGQMKQTPFAIRKLTLGAAEQRDLVGLVGEFPIQDALGFHIDGLISHQFFRRYAMTLDFAGMGICLQPGPPAG